MASLFLVTCKSNFNMQGAVFTKNMSVEVNTQLSNPFNNNGKEVIQVFVRKYQINASQLRSLSPNNFDVKKLS